MKRRGYKLIGFIILFSIIGFFERNSNITAAQGLDMLTQMMIRDEITNMQTQRTLDMFRMQPTIIQRNVNYRKPTFAERCITDHGTHSIPYDEKKNLCECEDGYTFGENDQCVWAAENKTCQEKHGENSIFRHSSIFCACKSGYIFYQDEQCLQGSNPTEVCKNMYGDNAIPSSNSKCSCKDGYKLVDQQCYETVWHKIKKFFLLLF